MKCNAAYAILDEAARQLLQRKHVFVDSQEGAIPCNVGISWPLMRASLEDEIGGCLPVHLYIWEDTSIRGADMSIPAMSDRCCCIKLPEALFSDRGTSDTQFQPCTCPSHNNFALGTSRMDVALTTILLTLIGHVVRFPYDSSGEARHQNGRGKPNLREAAETVYTSDQLFPLAIC
ncbi:hypothetical protein BU25DRAFT_262861 [Macroventuria anomochaeta]|uniref:Uncharacterized protein n=1 Tax=Macroventuria anomochaeta TaxID=301207 RepID=A0ACB6S8V1_9PLEO|nr:uncharacterized protein BU25DRAFT_262861 [Macroventuria anomochaeta]KAF2630010.1 hypothetical protein BU25DRAFT_262861 [Macroventuria anomochaeta]